MRRSHTVGESVPQQTTWTCHTGVTASARCESALGQCRVCFDIVRREVWWIEALPSSADKPGHEEVDTRPEGREVVEMKGGRTGPRRHICHRYSPGACRAWEPYLSPPKNSITHPSHSIRGALLLAWCLLCSALEHFSPTFFFPTSIRLSLTSGPKSLSFPSCLSSLLF